MTADVSLIVTTYNWPKALDLALASIAHQSQMPAEVIVADDGSGPDTAHVVRRWSERLNCTVKHVWQQDCGYRLARSRNRAIAAASADYVVLVDGDMILHPRFVEDHVHCSQADCFIQGARPCISPSMTQQLLSGETVRLGVFTAGIQHPLYALRNPFFSRWASKTRVTLAAVQGCNQSFWRKHILQVNGYDERFTAWGPEDREFAARLLHIGLKRKYVRHRAIAFHLHHSSRAPDGYNPFDRLLHETVLTRAVWCKNGVDSHLPVATARTAGPATEPACATSPPRIN